MCCCRGCSALLRNDPVPRVLYSADTGDASSEVVYVHFPKVPLTLDSSVESFAKGAARFGDIGSKFKEGFTAHAEATAADVAPAADGVPVPARRGFWGAALSGVVQASKSAANAAKEDHTLGAYYTNCAKLGGSVT